MEPELTAEQNSLSTAERILDAAEDLFAARGYSATSLGDVADRVGIRSPSLYNHFKNKEALYHAVLERLLQDFSAPNEALHAGAITEERLFDWLETIIRQHHANPNLARLLQHEALSGNSGAGALVESLFRPMVQGDAIIGEERIALLDQKGLQPWAVMGLNNLVMSYLTMAPMYADLLGEDPYSEAALQKQIHLVKFLMKAVLEYRGE